MPLPNPALNVQAEYKQDQFQSFYYRKPRENTNAWGNMIYFLKEQYVKIGFEQFLVLNIGNKFLWYRGWVDLSISWCLKAILLLKGKRTKVFYPCEHTWFEFRATWATNWRQKSYYFKHSWYFYLFVFLKVKY